MKIGDLVRHKRSGAHYLVLSFVTNYYVYVVSCEGGFVRNSPKRDFKVISKGYLHESR